MNGPYRLITTDDPCKTLAQGELRYFARIIDAANAFAKADEPWKTVNYDDGREARELNRDYREKVRCSSRRPRAVVTWGRRIPSRVVSASGPSASSATARSPTRSTTRWRWRTAAPSTTSTTSFPPASPATHGSTQGADDEVGAVSALLRQPHGFEGCLAIHEDSNSPDLAFDEVVDVRGWCCVRDLQTACSPAASDPHEGEHPAWRNCLHSFDLDSEVGTHIREIREPPPD
jgi:hypothetical protein